MVKIINENGREKDVKDLHLITQKQTTKEQVEDGSIKEISTDKEFVEMIVISNRGNYPYWMKLDKFNELNPEVNL